MNDIRDDVFEARLRVGVPIVRASACRAWSAHRCTYDLDILVDAGAHVLVRVATQSSNDEEFLERLLQELPSALERVTSAGFSSLCTTVEARP
ncbi:MAG: hypothetical protein FJ095_00345 [Deltaproteobacteria bacterium]|nr:hypothetical protein [Deltaproteobacteria bacterium]